ncbi:MAG: hypothetical protein E7171_07565 [Firmicutes bacterium]|nr:hypothetical protein [Bacillota bacterium]
MILKVLGTVSPHCHNEKNCPGYFVTTEHSKILLDCGNGITRNLNYPNDIQDLVIIISHLHRDHYSDLFSLAYDSYVYHNLGLLQNRIKVYIPIQTSNDTINDYNLLTNLGEENYLEIITYQQEDIITTKDTTISFSPNPHSIPSYSVKIKEKNNTLVYSGDTGYIGNTIEKFAQGANLLICESTFLQGQTRKKDYHLYAHEAAQIARQSEVDKLLLTHFWPDIKKELYLQEALPIFENTQVAEENLILKLH